MRRLRIAMYHATLPGDFGKKGGVEAAVHRLAQSLTQRGNCELTVFSSGTPPTGAMYQHRSILNPTNRRKLTRLLVSPVLLNTVDFSGFDVLHFHGDDWFFVRRNAPVVRTFNGSALHESRTAQSLKRRAMQRIVYEFEKLSARLATTSIAIGTETQQLYGSRYHIGLSVDMSIFAPRPKTPYPSVFYVGTWEGRKRGALLYKTFIERVLPRHPDAKLFFVSDHCPPHPSVVHLTKASDQDLAEGLAQSWVFAYPSLYEGFGIPYIEAMASGTAIVTTPNGGARDVLENGTFGLIRDDEAFGAAIVELLENEALRHSLAEAGLARAPLYSPDAICAQIEQVYRETADEYARRR